MVTGEAKGILADLERKLGLPKLSQIADSLGKFPDVRQLKTIKDVLVIAERVSQSAPQLDQVIMLIKEINSMPLEKLERLEKVLRRIEGILKKAPAELLEFLTSLREE